MTTTHELPYVSTKAVTGKPVDGWLFWRLPSGELLASLRDQLERPP